MDFFYTSFNSQGYLIPIEEIGSRTKTLRVKAIDENNPSINWAKDYEIEKVLKKFDDSITSFIPHKAKPRDTLTSNCIDCGKSISRSARRCKECNAKFIATRREEQGRNISRGELKEMIRNMPFVKIGEMYGVSDSAIRKWCEKLSLPKSKREINNYSDEEWMNI